MTDASDIEVGAVLQQRVNKVWQPLGFFSKRLQPGETWYNTFGRELLGNGNGLLTHLVAVTLIYNVFTIYGYKKGIYSIYLHVIH